MTFVKTTIQQRAIDLFISGANKFLLYGGSRSGKSFIIIFAMIIIACKFPSSRHLICRYRFNHVKNSIWLDTLKKVLKICFPKLSVKWNNQDYFITLPNGSEIWIGGLDDKDRSEKILGMEFLTIFVNESSQISYEAFTTLLTRLAQRIEYGEGKIAKNLLFIDCNPPSKKSWIYKVFVEYVEPETNISLSFVNQYGCLKMNPIDNIENISAEYIDLLNSLPERKKKRFLRGEFGDDNEGALWTDDIINQNRVGTSRTFNIDTKDQAYKRVVVSIDPAVTSKDTSDETGIVVCAEGFDGHLYVLEDATDIYTPNDWAKKSVSLYYKWKADRIIGEVNNGGDLIEAVLRQVDNNVSYKSVHATRDKLTRAEPVAALYEQGKGHHVGQHLDLELEMTSWEAKKGEKSPNRIDALVWGATELLLNQSQSHGSVW
jgi:phage terminase large subunit-like protein